MQEAEDKKTNATDLNKEIKNETLTKPQATKMRQKNYASPDCGAKILASNPEAQSTTSVLTDKKDDYLLSPCTDRIWFVVELCDSIQASRVELANFELFSSPLKSVAISVSNRFPTREWTTAGNFDAKIERNVQMFELNSQLFGKFVRVDLTYTNTEHYCPLSFFRIFGTSEIEAFETVENDPSNHIDDDGDDELEMDPAKVQTKDNLLNRAGAAVMHIVQKAAEVLAKGNDNGIKQTSKVQQQRKCITMSHEILCKNCSTLDRIQLVETIECKNPILLQFLQKNDAIYKHLINSIACNTILGFNLQTSSTEAVNNFIVSILPRRYIAAMCNLIAKDQNSLQRHIHEENIISGNLIPKKDDEVGLKNISSKTISAHEAEDPLCKGDLYVGPGSGDSTIIKEISEEKGEIDDDTQQKSGNTTGEDLNIFNVIERDTEDILLTSDRIEDTPSSTSTTDDAIENSSTNAVKQPEIEKVETEMPAIVAEPEIKIESHNNELKQNGEGRVANPPESVFLRLSNRIKILEKNVSLSTQYLEELSKRYKKQIEELQISVTKAQNLFDIQNRKQIEIDKQETTERQQLQSDLTLAKQRIEYICVALISLIAFFIVQTILMIALFGRMSRISQMLRNNQQEISNNTNIKSAQNRHKKIKHQRLRKISAPNILTSRQRNVNYSPILSRTVSAPVKFSVSTISTCGEKKESNGDLQIEQVLLEENDEILIPGFENLNINNDSDSVISINGEASAASTVSVVSSYAKESTKSFKFKRRLSSPFLLKKTFSLKNRTSEIMFKKAKSESPSRVGEPREKVLAKSQSFQNDNDENNDTKLKKSGNNSFKKLFKKLF